MRVKTLLREPREAREETKRSEDLNDSRKSSGLAPTAPQMTARVVFHYVAHS